MFSRRGGFDAQFDIRQREFSAWRYTESTIHRLIISPFLISQHIDGTWIRWDLTQVVDGAAVPVATSIPGIKDTNLVALMRTEDSILAMEENGKARLYPLP